MSIVLAAAIAVVMSVLLQILAEPVLRLLNTDPAVLDEPCFTCGFPTAVLRW